MRTVPADDAAFRALADGQRRQLLIRLRDHGPQRVQRLSGVSREIAEAHDTFVEEYLSGPLEIDRADKDLVRTHHVHLPELANHGFVEFDPTEHVVSRGPRFDDLAPLLEVVTERRGDRPYEGVVATR